MISTATICRPSLSAPSLAESGFRPASPNRVSASRLSEMAQILDVPIAFFFGDLQVGDTPQTPQEQELRERMDRPETIELIRLYYAIPDPRVRRQFLDLVKAVAKKGSA